MTAEAIRSRLLKDRESMRRARVRQLFMAQAAEEHTETGVLLFCKWLADHYPELVPQKGRGDPHKFLKGDLEGLYH